MGRQALTQADDGRERRPETPVAWEAWVSATATRNFVLHDPLLDWLVRYGETRGYVPDTARPDYDPRTDFTSFVFAQGHRFEAAVVAHLATRTEVITVADDWRRIREVGAAERTYDLMAAGAPVIAQGVLRDPEHEVYGAADLLMRSDVLAELFPASLTNEEAAVAAPAFPHGWHYRVVDIKFTTLHLAASGSLSNAHSAPAFKVQLWLYNRALGRVQEYTPPAAYVLGRSWEQRMGSQSVRGTTCMDRLVPVATDEALANGWPVATAVAEAVAWVRRLRADGGSWAVEPEPSVPELYPHMGQTQDAPWHATKREIAEALDELTSLWFVDVAGRRAGHAAGIRRWTDPACTAAAVGLSGARASTLDAMLALNRGADGPPVRPAQVTVAEAHWREPQAVEFFVDFEWVTDVADDFREIPMRGGQALIFMIGCGHVEDGRWQFAGFTADRLTVEAESATFDAWLEHMRAVTRRLGAGTAVPRLYHWSAAETSALTTAFNAAQKRHPDKAWPALDWCDLLTEVVRKQPFLVRGAMGFGLKAIARAFHQHGLIATSWEDGPTDGLGAMVGAWWCDGEAAKRGCRLTDLDLLQEIQRYNEVDCRVMHEVLEYLRTQH